MALGKYQKFNNYYLGCASHWLSKIQRFCCREVILCFKHLHNIIIKDYLSIHCQCFDRVFDVMLVFKTAELVCISLYADGSGANTIIWTIGRMPSYGLGVVIVGWEGGWDWITSQGKCHAKMIFFQIKYWLIIQLLQNITINMITFCKMGMLI